ncbi:hypothetical protein Hanom_Chr12g01169621 [Helianthus anomalus]
MAEIDVSTIEATVIFQPSWNEGFCVLSMDVMKLSFEVEVDFVFISDSATNGVGSSPSKHSDFKYGLQIVWTRG